MSVPLTNDAVALIDWLNLSIRLKAHGREFGPSVARLLLSVARREADVHGVHLARAHFVAESFSPAVERVLEQDLTAQVHKTRTAKEQADLMLAVLTMDHLHHPGGTPGLFVIATGDQDFVPLVERLIEERTKVVLVAGSLSDLAPEYRSIVTQHNVKLIGLVESENVPLLKISKDSDEATLGVVALLRLVLEGGRLGGSQEQNARKLALWRVAGSAGEEEERVQAWIKEFTVSEMRRVADPGKGSNGNHVATRRRTSLDFTSTQTSHRLLDLDWILRRCDAGGKAPTKGSLGVGRFADDDGQRVGSAVSALEKIGWLQGRADSSLVSTFPWAADGFVEPLCRLIAVAQALSFEAQSEGIDRDRLWKGLASSPLGASSSRRGGSAAAELIMFGRNVGVIDAFSAEGGRYVLGAIPGHALVRRLSSCVRLLKTLLPSQVWLAEHALLDAIREAERDTADPLFGFDSKDRRSTLRPLTRAGVLVRKDVGGEFQVRLRDTAWVAHV